MVPADDPARSPAQLFEDPYGESRRGEDSSAFASRGCHLLPERCVQPTRVQELILTSRTQQLKEKITKLVIESIIKTGFLLQR